MEVALIKHLETIERLIGVNTESMQEVVPYKRFDQTWIRADASLSETYASSIKASEIQFYPNKNIKSWIKQGFNILKSKNDCSLVYKLVGVWLTWHFIKVVKLPLLADIIYYRHRAVIMVYTRMKIQIVIKVAVTDRGIRDMRNEAESQRLAATISAEGIGVCKIIKEFHDDNLNFTVEEYFIGKKQSFTDRKILEENYGKVFDFLIKFYLKNPIELQVLSDNKFLNHDFVEAFIEGQRYGETIVSIYKKLLIKEKMMIKCRIHGDLNHNNILSNENQICIIDWGQSKHNYLALELDNSSYNTKHVFDELIEKANIDRNQIYSYEEQLFIGRYIEMNRSVYGKIKSKKITPHYYKWIESENIKLLKRSENLDL